MKDKAVKKTKTKKPWSLFKKIMLAILGIALLGAVIYFTYYLFNYLLYNRYRDFLTTYTVEEGRPYQPLTNSVNKVPGFELVAENEYLKLYTDPASTGVAVYDKRNGEVYFTNPPDADQDTVANKVNIDNMKSQFILVYFNRQVRVGTYDSYSMSVEKGQFTIEAIDNGVRYRYRIGELPKINTGTVPLYLHEDQIAELAAKMDERNGLTFTRIYVTSNVGPGMRQINNTTLNNSVTLGNMQTWLDEIGWTEEDFLKAMEKGGDAAIENIPISFDIALEYRLEGDSLKVSVPASEIKSYGGGSVFQIQLLRMMGAAGSLEDGYFVVPNGSGALIDFNNGKQFYPIYQQSIYGIEPLAAVPIRSENTDNVKLPFYGICRENSSILVEVEEGKTLASISAVVSGTFNNYNYAYPTFWISGADNLINFGSSNIDVFVREPDIYDVNLTVRYSFLTDEYKGYAGLANYYREKLLREGKLTQLADIATAAKPLDIPFYYDVIGGIKETNHFLGVQHLRIFPMTTFANAKVMAFELEKEGINKQVMNFQGWFNGGFYHNTPHKISLVRKLGSKAEFEGLSAQIEDNGGRFYADVAFQYIPYTDRFANWQALSSRYYGLGFVAAEGQVCPCCLWAITSLGYGETFQLLMSPKFLPRYVEKFTSRIDRYDIGGISLRELTSWLHADKRRTNIINREESLNVVLAQLKLLESSGKNLMGSGSYDYSFPYLTDIINAPTKANRFFIIDHEIPLYEMIIHGSINFAGPLLNFNYEEDKSGVVLNHIEYGASPHYAFTWEEANKMKNTGMNRYVNTTFAIWKNEAVNIYHQINEALRYVSGAFMVNHQILDDNVRAVSYSNGITIYLNYNNESVFVNGSEILPRSYWIMEN
ncbi:MAG: DUF5696 domain-containing protein [Lachnospiraceae bacterium]|nr:DUF5696 domain-containing protein [Lachnospiraceae bacterium]